MGRKLVIGNINSLPGAAATGRGRGLKLGLGLGGRLKRLGSQVLDQAEARAKAEIQQNIPSKPGTPIGPKSLPGLADELSPEEQEQILEGLEVVMGALQSARGRSARKTRNLVQGLYEAVAGMDDEDDDSGAVRGGRGSYGGSSEEDYADDTGGGVDIIGLDGSGGLVRPTDPGEWR